MHATWANKGRHEESREKVLKLFSEKPDRRWGELLESAGMSSATLKKNLDELVHEGKLVRNTETDTGKYPPPVLYFLTAEGLEFTRPYAFAIYSKWWASGFTIQWEKPTGLTIKWERPKGPIVFLIPNIVEEAPTAIIEEIGRREYARYLYAVAKAIETRNWAWAEAADVDMIRVWSLMYHLRLRAEPAVLGQIREAKILDSEGSNMLLSIHLEKEDIALNSEGKGLARIRFDGLGLSESACRRFSSIAEKAYAEEFRALDSIYMQVMAQEAPRRSSHLSAC